MKSTRTIRHRPGHRHSAVPTYPPHPLLRVPRLGFAPGFSEAMDEARSIAPELPADAWEAVRSAPLHGDPALVRLDARALVSLARRGVR